MFFLEFCALDVYFLSSDLRLSHLNKNLLTYLVSRKTVDLRTLCTGPYNDSILLITKPYCYAEIHVSLLFTNLHGLEL